MDNTTPSSELNKEEMIEGGGGAEEEQEVLLSPKSDRERDLLAIIASKDKRIQQLEERLQAQATFIDAILKLSDDFKLSSSTSTKGRGGRARSPPARRGVRRNVSWDKSVDEQQSTGGFWREKRATFTKYKTGYQAGAGERDDGEINVDDVDNLLLDDDNDEAIKEAEKFKKKLAATKSEHSTEPKSQPKPQPEKTEVDAGQQPQATPKKKVKSKKESKVVEAIIDGLRNDDDSVEC